MLYISSMLGLLFLLVSQQAAQGSTLGKDVFAVVNGQIISMASFHTAFSNTLRKSYFHGKVPAAQLASFQRKVVDQTVERELLRQEALSRGIVVDAQYLNIQLAQLKPADPLDLQALRKSIETDSLVQQLRHGVIGKIKLEVDDVRQYYKMHTEKFTIPERMQVAMILLKVEPSAGAQKWRQANDVIQSLMKQLDEGEQFSVLARQYSNHASAQDGGSLGQIHQGMFARTIEQALSKLEIGQHSDAIMLLQGIALFVVEARSEKKTNPFERVQARARKLAMQAAIARTWQQFTRRLHQSADIVISTNLPPVVEP